MSVHAVGAGNRAEVHDKGRLHQTDVPDATLTRKAVVGKLSARTKTDTGRRGEKPKALE